MQLLILSNRSTCRICYSESWYKSKWTIPPLVFFTFSVTPCPTDYIQHIGSAIASLSPCSIPQRLYRQAQSLLRSLLPWSNIASKTGIQYSRTMWHEAAGWEVRRQEHSFVIRTVTFFCTSEDVWFFSLSLLLLLFFPAVQLPFVISLPPYTPTCTSTLTFAISHGFPHPESWHWTQVQAAFHRSHARILFQIEYKCGTLGTIPRSGTEGEIW